MTAVGRGRPPRGPARGECGQKVRANTKALRLWPRWTPTDGRQRGQARGRGQKAWAETKALRL
jgi:hypothetical protein